MPAQTRTRNDPRREATRQKILDAVQQIAATRGTGALTKAAICREAGIQPSAIYAHFRSVDECVEAAARQFAEGLLKFSKATRTRERIGVDAGPARAIAIVRDNFRGYAGLDPTTRQLIAQCRHDDSALGRVVRDSIEVIIQQLAQELWVAAAEAGLKGRDVDVFRSTAERTMDLMLGGYARIREDPRTDIEALSEDVGRWVFHGVASKIAALLVAQNEAQARGR